MDLLDKLGELVAKKVLNLVLVGSQAGTSLRQNMKKILTFSRLDHCALAVTFLGLK